MLANPLDTRRKTNQTNIQPAVPQIELWTSFGLSACNSMPKKVYTQNKKQKQGHTSGFFSKLRTPFRIPRNANHDPLNLVNNHIFASRPMGGSQRRVGLTGELQSTLKPGPALVLINHSIMCA